MHQAIQFIGVTIIAMAPQVRKRVSQDAVRRLAQTILRVGVRTPLRVRRVGNKFLVVDGHLRLLAARAAGLSAVPCIIEDKDLGEAEICELQLILNRRREELRPVEFAAAVKRYMEDAQCTASEAAARLGESPATISRHLALLKLPEAIRDRVDSGAIPASAAYKLAQVDDAREQEALAVELSAGRLTREQLGGKSPSQGRRGGASGQRRNASRITVALAGGRSVTFSGPGLQRVGDLISLLETLLTEARSHPACAEVAAFVAALRQAAQTSAAANGPATANGEDPTPAMSAARA